MRSQPRGLSPILFLLAVAVVLGSAPPVEADTFPWQRPPGPIAGRWRMGCAVRGPMVIEVVLRGDKAAVGRVAEIGGGARFGYTVGQEVLRVEANDFGAWVGEQLWRGVSGLSRWDPIHLVATADTLNADMTTDECWKNMARVQ